MIDLGGAYVVHSISFLSIEDVKQGLWALYFHGLLLMSNSSDITMFLPGF